jgi:hypothetical protein
MKDGVVPQLIGLTNVVGATLDFPTEEKRRRHNPKSNPLAARAFTLCGQTPSVRQVPVHERHRPLPFTDALLLSWVERLKGTQQCRLQSAAPQPFLRPCARLQWIGSAGLRS